jgi:FkbM family methyltransferase
MAKFHRLKLLLKQIQNELKVQYRLFSQPTLVEMEGIKLKINDYFSQSIKDNIYRGYYEIYELSIVKSQLSAHDIVLEIGAGIGFISTYCAKRIGSEKVFSYEANPDLEKHIQNTYQLNNVSPTLEICLVGNQIGKQTFYLENNFWSSSITPWNQNAKPITVSAKSFNEEVRRHNPTFLIIDIEGGEYELFKKADFYNVKKIMMELHTKLIGVAKAKFVKDRLQEAGFQINENYSRENNGMEELFLERSN